MPKCDFKECEEEATKRVKLEIVASSKAIEISICEPHLFKLTDHGFKLVAKVDDEGGVELWRPSW